MKIDGKCTNFTHKWNFRDKRGTPMVPKILFLKNSASQLSNAVSTVPIALLDQKLQPAAKKRVVRRRTFIWVKFVKKGGGKVGGSQHDLLNNKNLK